MKRLFSCALVLALCTGFAALQDKKACDNKTIEKAPFCKKCSALDPKLDKDKKCDTCHGEITKADVCVKTCYECKGCHMKMAEDKPCCKDNKNEKQTVKSRIIYKCEGCGATADKEGDCTKCKEAKKKCKCLKTCEASGTWPHGGEAPHK